MRTPEARDRGGVRRPPGRGERHDRVARAADRRRPQHGLRSDRPRRADRLRSLPKGQDDGLLRGHDPHLRRRRAVGRGEGVAPAGEGGSRHIDRRRQAGRQRPPPLRGGLRDLPRRRLQDAAQQGTGRGARGRVLPRPRPRCGPRGARAPFDGQDRARPRSGRRRHDRARPLPSRVRRPAPRGSRARHEGRVRSPHGLPVRPKALTNTIETMLLEERRYAPDPEFARQANARPEIYERDWEEFWETEGRNRVTWFEPFSRLYEWEPPYAKWYLGGRLNVCFNCVDRHVEAGNGDKVAYFWEGEPGDERRTITFADLQREVVRFANALKKLGVAKGTPVGIYMGMVPELPIAMLACARIGAPHTVVFGGFSSESLSDRMNDMECALLITQDEGWRAGKKVPLKQNADEAVAQAPTVKNVVVLKRTGDQVPFDTSRDAWWHELVEGQDDDPASAPPEPMDAEDLLYLLYTSGTTAKPKGIEQVFGVHRFGRRRGRIVILPLDELVPPGVPRRVEGDLIARSFQYDDILHRRRLRHGFVSVLLERHLLAGAPPLVLRDQERALHVVHTIRQGFAREASEDDGVRRPDARAREHRDRQLRDHAHVDADRRPLRDAEFLERVREAHDFALQIGKRDR